MKNHYVRSMLASLVVLMSGCGGGSDNHRPATTGGAVSMKASDWAITYSTDIAPHPTQNGFGWYFDWGKGTVHYVLVPFKAATKPTVLEMKFRIVTNGDVHFHPTSYEAQVKANFRPMLEIEGDDMAQEYGRFWSNQVSYELAADNEIHTFIVPLTADHWTSVYGHTDQQQFNRMLANLGKVGFTFGGMFYGHGVYVTGGTARFELLSFAVR